jgi:hypothetical protein
MVGKRAESGEHTEHYQRWIKTWWQPHWPRSDFFAGLSTSARMICCSNPQARPIFAFLSTAFVPTNTMQVFAFQDDYSFGIIQSSLHWNWLQAKGGKVSVRPRYTTDVWRTFPWPQQVTAAHVENVARAGRELRATRRELMAANRWSLRALYQAADVPGPHPLKLAQARLDDAVAAAYDLPADQDPLEFLLELNQVLAEDEAEGHSINGPGLPPELDAADPRWSSDDCITPPAPDGADH